jgi:hypothetical protein
MVHAHSRTAVLLPTGGVHETLSAEARDQGVSDLIDLVGAVDGLLQIQARADADDFVMFADEPCWSRMQSACTRARWARIGSNTSSHG